MDEKVAEFAEWLGGQDANDIAKLLDDIDSAAANEVFEALSKNGLMNIVPPFMAMPTMFLYGIIWREWRARRAEELLREVEIDD